MSSLRNENIEIEEGLEVIKLTSSSTLEYEILAERNYIFFIYSPEKVCGLEWPDHGATHILNPLTILLYAYPLKDTSFKVSLTEKATTYLIKVSIARLHQFFGNSFGSNPDEVQAFVGSFRMKNIYSEKVVTPAVSVIFHQMVNHGMGDQLGKMYMLGKVMEFLTFFMKKPGRNEKLARQCPFINDHLEMEKISEARDLIVKNITNPPNLKELAHMVGTNEFKLKVGFKSMFGNTVYGYLNDYRMEKAHNLLEEKKHTVKEISTLIGYSNSSHFIAAYKKKFGVTPKKYLQTLN